MSKPLIQTTGRRKESIARVRLRPGTGQIVVNGRPFAAVLPDPDAPGHRQGAAAAHADRRGLRRRRDARRRRRERSGRRDPPRHRPGARRARPRHARRAEEGRPAHARRAREGTAQVRPQEGPQGAAVLEAVDAPPPCCGSAPTASAATPTPISPTTFVVALGRAAARVLGPGRVRRRPRHARVGTADRGRARCAVSRLEGVERRAGRRAADARRSPTSRSATTRPRRSISASHNAWTDNGVKLIGGRRPQAARRGRGRDRARARGAARGDAGRRCRVVDVARPRSCRRVRRAPRRRARGPHARRAARRARLRERRRVDVGPRALRAAGCRRRRAARRARRPQHQRRAAARRIPTSLQAAVRAHGADVGLALDGDADRVIAVDEHGDDRRRRPDHDRARARPRRARRAAQRRDRGHRDVEPRPAPRAGRGRHRRSWRRRSATATSLAALDEHDLVLGGEQSGHVIFRDLATTGDGVLTGLLVVRSRASHRAGRCRRSPRACTRFPQVLVSVPRRRACRSRRRATRLRDEIAAVEAELGDARAGPGARVGYRAGRAGHGRGADRAEAEAAVARLRRAVEAAFRVGSDLYT